MIDAFLYGAYPRESLFGFDEDIVRDLSGRIYNDLDRLRGRKFREVASEISSREDLQINTRISEAYGSPFLPALFFFVKDEVRKGGDEFTANSLDFIRSAGEEYPELFSRLLTLIGGFFGYSWIYDRYYEALGMPFVKNRLELKPIQEDAAETVTEEAKPVEDKEKKEKSAPGDLSEPAEEPALERVEPGEEKDGDVVPHQSSVQDEGEETIEDLFGSRQSFTEFAIEVYMRSIAKVTKNKSIREARFADSLSREGTKNELLGIVRSGQSFQLTEMKNRLDPEFSPSQWEIFKGEIMTFNK